MSLQDDLRFYLDQRYDLQGAPLTYRPTMAEVVDLLATVMELHIKSDMETIAILQKAVQVALKPDGITLAEYNQVVEWLNKLRIE